MAIAMAKEEDLVAVQEPLPGLGRDLIIARELSEVQPKLRYGKKVMDSLVASMPSPEAMSWLKKNGYGLLPQPPQPLSILDIRELVPKHFYARPGGEYDDEPFAANDLTGAGWLAIKKTPAECTMNHTLLTQESFISSACHVPNAAEMAWFIAMLYEVRKIRLFEHVYVRTSSCDRGGNHVNIGHIPDLGLNVHATDDTKAYASLGLAVALNL